MIQPKEDNYSDLFATLYLPTCQALRKFKPIKRKSPPKNATVKYPDDHVIDSFLVYNEDEFEQPSTIPFIDDDRFV